MHRWVVVFVHIAVCLPASGQLGCGGDDEGSDEPPGPEPPCQACAGSYQVCASPEATESVDVVITELTDAGCTLEIQPPSSGSVDIRCEPLQVCDGNDCRPAALTTSALTWGTASCYR